MPSPQHLVRICIPGHSADASVWPRRYSRRGAFADGDASSSWLYVSDALCPRAPGGLYAPAGCAGDAFTVAVAVWMLGEGEGAGGITAGKGGAVEAGRV